MHYCDSLNGRGWNSQPFNSEADTLLLNYHRPQRSLSRKGKVQEQVNFCDSLFHVHVRVLVIGHTFLEDKLE